MMDTKSKVFYGLDVVIELQKKYPKHTFAIAGGAARDFILEKEIRDIDIYSTRKFLYTKELNDALPDYLNAVQTFSSEYNSNTVYKIKNKTNFNAPDIELICVDGSLFSTVKSFDIGLCMAYITATGNLHVLPEFRKDQKNGTMTFYPNRLDDYSAAKAVKYHIPKLTQKFPEHKLVIDYEQD